MIISYAFIYVPHISTSVFWAWRGFIWCGWMGLAHRCLSSCVSLSACNGTLLIPPRYIGVVYTWFYSRFWGSFMEGTGSNWDF